MALTKDALTRFRATRRDRFTGSPVYDQGSGSVFGILSEDTVVTLLFNEPRSLQTDTMDAKVVSHEHADHVQLILCYLRSIWPWSPVDLRNIAIRLCADQECMSWPGNRHDWKREFWTSKAATSHMALLLKPSMGYAFKLSTPQDVWYVLQNRCPPPGTPAETPALEPSIPFIIGRRHVMFVSFNSALPSVKLPSHLTNISLDQSSLASSNLSINKQALVLQNAIFPGHQLVIMYLFDEDYKASAMTSTTLYSVVRATATSLMLHAKLKPQDCVSLLQVHSASKPRPYETVAKIGEKKVNLFYVGGGVNTMALERTAKPSLLPIKNWTAYKQITITDLTDAQQKLPSGLTFMPQVAPKSLAVGLKAPQMFRSDLEKEMANVARPLGLDLQSFLRRPDNLLIVILFARTSLLPMNPLISQIRTLLRAIRWTDTSRIRIRLVLESLSSHQTPWEDRPILTRASDDLVDSDDADVVILTTNPDRLTRRAEDLPSVFRQLSKLKARWLSLNLNDPQDPTRRWSWAELFAPPQPGNQEAPGAPPVPPPAGSSSKQLDDDPSSSQMDVDDTDPVIQGLLEQHLTKSRQLASQQGQYTRSFLHQISVLERLSRDRSIIRYFKILAELLLAHIKARKLKEIVIVSRTSPALEGTHSFQASIERQSTLLRLVLEQVIALDATIGGTKIDLPGVSAVSGEALSEVQKRLSDKPPSLLLTTTVDRIVRNPQGANDMRQWAFEKGHSVVSLFWQGTCLSSSAEHDSLSKILNTTNPSVFVSDLMSSAIPEPIPSDNSDLRASLESYVEELSKGATCGSQPVSNPFLLPIWVFPRGHLNEIVDDHILSAFEFAEAFAISSAQSTSCRSPKSETQLYEHLFGKMTSNAMLNEQRVDLLRHFTEMVTAICPLAFYASRSNGGVECHCAIEENGVPEYHDPNCVCPCQVCALARAILCPFDCDTDGLCTCGILCTCTCLHCHRPPKAVVPPLPRLPRTLAELNQELAKTIQPTTPLPMMRNRRLTGRCTNPRKPRQEVFRLYCDCSEQLLPGKRFCSQCIKCIRTSCNQERQVKHPWCSRQCYGSDAAERGVPTRLCKGNPCDVPCPPGTGTFCDKHAQRHS